jgi:gliding motility-associated-like protein
MFYKSKKIIKFTGYRVLFILINLLPTIIYCQSDPELIILEEEYMSCSEQMTELKIVVTGTPPVSITYLYNDEPGNANSSTDTILLPLTDIGIFVITGFRDCCSDYIPASDTILIERYDSLSVSFTGGGYQCDAAQFSPLVVNFEGTPPFILSCFVNNVAETIFSDTYTQIISYPYDFELITREVSDLNCTSEYIDTLYVINGDIPAPEIIGDTIACLNSVSVFSVDNDMYYASWSIPGISVYYFDATSNGSFIQVTWSEPGIYEIIVKLLNTQSGCESPETQINVAVFESPVVRERIDTISCMSEGSSFEISFPTLEGETVYWPSLDYGGATLNFTEPGSYDYILTNESGCTDTGILILTDNCAPEIYVPTAFTPNGDGLNDQLTIFGIFSELDFSVYTPSGILLFRNSGNADYWDGTSDGKDVPEGSYYWHAIFNDRNNVQRSKNGLVTIIR